jgi:hypothetical protein
VYIFESNWSAFQPQGVSNMIHIYVDCFLFSRKETEWLCLEESTKAKVWGWIWGLLILTKYLHFLPSSFTLIWNFDDFGSFIIVFFLLKELAKKIGESFLIYEKIWKRSGDKSNMMKDFLIYDEMRYYSVIQYKMQPLNIYGFAPDPFQISLF